MEEKTPKQPHLGGTDKSSVVVVVSVVLVGQRQATLLWLLSQIKSKQNTFVLLPVPTS